MFFLERKIRLCGGSLFFSSLVLLRDSSLTHLRMLINIQWLTIYIPTYTSYFLMTFGSSYLCANSPSVDTCFYSLFGHLGCEEQKEKTGAVKRYGRVERWGEGSALTPRPFENGQVIAPIIRPYLSTLWQRIASTEMMGSPRGKGSWPLIYPERRKRARSRDCAIYWKSGSNVA